MKKRDLSKFRELMHMAAVMTKTYGKNVEDAVTVYFAALEPYSLAEVKAAVMWLCNYGDGEFPTVPDIRSRIEGSVEDRAALAWASVLRAMARWGYYDSVRFPDPAIHFAISQMGGWMHLCATLKDETIPFRGKDFAQYYAMGKRLGPQARPAAYLVGKHEANARERNCHFRRVYDTATGKAIPESELPALGDGQAAALVRMVAGGMEVPA